MPPADERGPRGKVATTVLIVAAIVGLGGLGLWLDCRNAGDARADLRKGMGCVLGTRPLPRTEVRARLDVVARGMAERGESAWPRACARYFHRAAGHATGAWAGKLGAAERVVATGDLDAIAATMLSLYDDEDYSVPVK